MRSNFGKKIKVGTDLDDGWTPESADVTLVIEGNAYLLSPKKARKLARKLDIAASRIEIAAGVRS